MSRMHDHTHRITADPMNLMEDAAWTADHFMRHAIRLIDGLFGEGSAKGRPELVSAFMRAASLDLLAVTLSQQLRLGLESIADEIAERERP